MEEKTRLMGMKDFKIVFMGTPEFSVCILDELVKNNQQVIGVITAPDKPAGRGQRISESAVKQYALENDLNILQPTNLKDPEFIEQLKGLHADLFVVVAFRMLPEVVWSMPPKGTINLHASILPNYRGAAPINWAIINGEKETGVTTFFIEKEIDTGKIIEREAVLIGDNESAGDLHDRLMHLGAKLTLQTVEKIILGDVQGIPQIELTEGTLKSAPKIFKPDCEINWDAPVEVVHDFCRGLSPYPTAWCTLYNKMKGESKTFKLFRTEKTELIPSDSVEVKGTTEGILIPCKDFYLLVKELQPEGKRRMKFNEFMAGHTMADFSRKL
jgi:methionyl-tRNA formyltransferase